MRKRLRFCAAVLVACMTLSLMATSVTVHAEEAVLQQDSRNAGTIREVSVSGTYQQTKARSMMERINQFRLQENQWQWNEDNRTKKYFNTNSSNQLRALTYDPELERIAMIRARELAVIYSHTRPNGESYDSLHNGAYISGENIANGTSSASLAARVETMWEEEDTHYYSQQAHRRNLLRSNYKSIGIACYYCNGYYYWVQEFSGKPANGSLGAADDSSSIGTVQYSDSQLDVTQTLTSVFYHFDTDDIEQRDYMYGQPLVFLPDHSRSGYNFDGWYTAENGGDPITPKTVPGFIGDLQAYPHWSEATASTSPTPTTPSVNPTTPSNPTTSTAGETGTQSFVHRMYQVVLGRQPDEGGMNGWVNRLNSGEAQAVDIVFGFVNSSEYISQNKSNGAIVQDCYQAMLGREPDEAGYNDWVSKLDTGMSVNAILAGFVGSQEFGNLCASYGIQPGSYSSGENRDQNIGVTSYVARLYTQALGRDYDPDGLNDWCGKILANTDRNNIIQVAANGFFHSQEFENKGLNDEEYVKVLYRTFLGREAEAEGLESWKAELANGKSRDDILPGFANSQEFTDIMAQYGL